MSIKKDNAHFKDLYERIIKFFDDNNMLSYARVDVQISPKTNKKSYFQAVVLNPYHETYIGEADPPERIERPVYICTQRNNDGVDDISDLPKAWLLRLIEFLRDPDHPEDIDPKFRGLAANSIEELELKMSVLGI